MLQFAFYEPNRVRNMIQAMDKEGFGGCTNQEECEAVCPRKISVEFIGKMNREYLRALMAGDSDSGTSKSEAAT